MTKRIFPLLFMFLLFGCPGILTVEYTVQKYERGAESFYVCQFHHENIRICETAKECSDYCNKQAGRQ